VGNRSRDTIVDPIEAGGTRPLIYRGGMTQAVYRRRSPSQRFRSLVGETPLDVLLSGFPGNFLFFQALSHASTNYYNESQESARKGAKDEQE